MSRRFAAALALLLAALGVVWGPAAPASACDCVGATTADHFARADVVFTGTLVSREVSHPNAPNSSSLDPALHVFAVDEVFKGDAGERQEVVSAADGASCGLELSGSGPVAVFATRDAGMPPGQYAASLCGGSGPLTEALDADLRSLGTATPPVAARATPVTASTPATSSSGTGPWPWLIAGGVVLVAVGLLGWRRRRGLSGK